MDLKAKYFLLETKLRYMETEPGISMLMHNKDDIEFVTEFLCLLGHPVSLEGQSTEFQN